MTKLLKKWFPQVFDRDRLLHEEFENMDLMNRIGARNSAIVNKGAVTTDPMIYVEKRLKEIREKYPWGWVSWAGVGGVHYTDSKNPELDYWVLHRDPAEELDKYEALMKESHEMAVGWKLNNVQN